eukprot:gene1059-2480_t
MGVWHSTRSLLRLCLEGERRSGNATVAGLTSRVYSREANVGGRADKASAVHPHVLRLAADWGKACPADAVAFRRATRRRRSESRDLQWLERARPQHEDNKNISQSVGLEHRHEPVRRGAAAARQATFPIATVLPIARIAVVPQHCAHLPQHRGNVTTGADAGSGAVLDQRAREARRWARA